MSEEKTFLFRLSFTVKGDKAKEELKEFILSKLKEAKEKGVVESGLWRIMEQIPIVPMSESGEI